MKRFLSFPSSFAATAACLAVCCAASACGGDGSDGTSAPPVADHRAEVTALLKSLETRDTAPASVIDPNKYIQHNPNGVDGVAGFLALLTALPPSTRANTVRVFQDGEFVFAHTDYDLFGPQAAFDIFRYENGKIVEHWDNLQPKPATANPSGHTMLDGTTTASGHDDAILTGRNKAMVQAFMNDVVVGGHADALAGYVDGDRLVQHDPAIADGVAAYHDALAAQAAASTDVVLHEVLADGDFVIAISARTVAGTPLAAYDLFRVEGGKIAEHWDVVATIAPPAEWRNGNGKFGF